MCSTLKLRNRERPCETKIPLWNREGHFDLKLMQFVFIEFLLTCGQKQSKTALEEWLWYFAETGLCSLWWHQVMVQSVVICCQIRSFYGSKSQHRNSTHVLLFEANRGCRAEQAVTWTCRCIHWRKTLFRQFGLARSICRLWDWSWSLSLLAVVLASCLWERSTSNTPFLRPGMHWIWETKVQITIWNTFSRPEPTSDPLESTNSCFWQTTCRKELCSRSATKQQGLMAVIYQTPQTAFHFTSLVILLHRLQLNYGHHYSSFSNSFSSGSKGRETVHTSLQIVFMMLRVASPTKLRERIFSNRRWKTSTSKLIHLVLGKHFVSFEQWNVSGCEQ